LGESGSKGKFYIAGYGKFPRECQKNGAECDITICGRNTLDIVAFTRKDAWRFSITGDIGPLGLVDHVEHPTSGKQNTIDQLFPTRMGSNWDVFQSYQFYLRTKANVWILTDPFTNLDCIIMVSRIFIRYIYYGRINEEHMTKSTLKMLLYFSPSLTPFGHSSFTNLGGTTRSRKSLLCHKR
jgi:hypothetical protein